jgi:hypothetical protein
MSERMIELQRAKLGIPTAGTPPSAPIHNSSRASTPAQQSPGAGTPQKTPQQLASAAVLSEDTQKKRFLHRLQRRNDSHPTAGSTSAPTVPTALSRRILHRQGVGYLDDTVAATISASADRFLATVFQQALACRDQRLKGAEMAREAARHRKRHMQHYEADMDDRKRRKEGREQAQEHKHLKAIAAAEALKKGGGSGKASDDKKSKKKKKKPEDEEPMANGVKPTKVDDDDFDDESYDSIDEEEEYYQERLGGGEVKGRLKGDDEEDDDTLLLRDLVHPLEAWDVRLTGKEALVPTEPDSDVEDGVDDIDEQAENSASPHQEENGNEEGLSFDFDGENGENDQKRKTASSPAPKTS